MMDYKVCKGCNEEKSQDEFYKNPSCADGLNPYCVSCQAQKIKDKIDSSLEIKRCIICDDKFKQNAPNQKYCTGKCMQRAIYISQSKKREGRTCKKCGTEFTCSKVSTKKYCSPKCRKKNKKDRKVQQVLCDLCGQSFLKKESNIGKTKHNYCCREHFYIHRRIRKKIICKCDYCGNKVEMIKSRFLKNNHVFCDTICMGRSKRTYAGITDDYKSILTQEEYYNVYHKMRERQSSKENRLNLSDSYIKDLLRQQAGVIKNIPQALIEAKREQVKIKRELKNK